MPTPHARLVQTIKRNALQAGKCYAYDNKSPVDQPITWFFQKSNEGVVLFIVFRTLPCVYNRCQFCRLPGTSTLRKVNFQKIMRQIDNVFAHPDVARMLNKINKIIVSNQGSVLDERTFDQLSLMYLLAVAEDKCPKLGCVCLETRIEYIDDDEISLLGHAMAGGDTPTVLELGIGMEAFDNVIRNGVLGKGMHLTGHQHSLERLAERLSRFELRFKIKIYFLQKPTEDMTDEQAIQDVCGCIDFLSQLVGTYSVPINLHLNPTFSAIDTPLEREFKAGRYKPPRLTDVAKAVLHADGTGVTVFVGLDDEGLACDGGSFLLPGNECMVNILQAFNETQDFDALREALETYMADPGYDPQTGVIRPPAA